MALSEQEKRMLEEIERALIAEDPRLARRASERSGSTNSAGLGLRSVALMMLGLVMLIGGIALAQNSLWFVALSVLGFLVMFFGGVLMFKPELNRVSGGEKKKSASVKSKLSKGLDDRGEKKRGDGGFGDRLEDSFRRRFEG